MTAIFAGVVLAHCVAAAPATRPAAVTMRLKDVKPQAVIDEFNRQSRLQLRVMDDESLPAKVSIEVDGLTPLLALREVCAALHVSPSASGEPETMALEPDETFLKKPFAVSGPVMVVIDSMEHSKTVHAAGREASSTFEVYLTALIDPAVRVLAHHPAVKVSEAVDDRGNSLAPKKPAEEEPAEADDVDLDWSAASILQIDLTAGLAYPEKDPGKRIARLKGSVTAHVLERSERWELAEPMKAREQAKSAAGVRYVVGGVSKKEESYLVQLTLHRETASDAQWQQLQNLAHPALVRLLDKEGKALAFEGVQEHDTGGRRCRITLAYASQDPITERPLGEPAKLVWELPVEVRAAELPFELRDVPMP